MKNSIKLFFAFSFIFTLRAMEEKSAYDVVSLKRDADLFFNIVTDQHSIAYKLKLQNLNDSFLPEALEKCENIISTLQKSKQKQHFINLLAPSLHFYEFFPSYYEFYLNFVEYLKNKDLSQEIINQSLLNLEELSRINESIQNIRESSKN